MLFIVNDEKNYALIDALRKQKDGIDVAYVEDVRPDDPRVRVYINVKPDRQEDVCFIDSWGLSEDIPQAHIVSKQDDEQKIRKICDVLHL